jgi:MoxR-like ATPase
LTGTQSGAPAAAQAHAALVAVRGEIAKAVVGQDGAVSGLMVALICRGHVLLEGVPGVAKTLLVRALSTALDLRSTRVQFTPDLMPGDVTGSLIYDARSAEFTFRPGPVFTNLLIADEINRTPPKTQAGLLEAMEERQVSVDGVPRPLPEPFLVAATQNPVDYEGTYPLPEAQLDRFLLKLVLPLPSRAEEIAVLDRHARGFDPGDLVGAGVRRVAGPAELAAAHAAALQVAVRPEIARGAAWGVTAGDDCVAGRRPRVGLVVGTGLRLARRRQGAGRGGPAAPDLVARRGRTRRRRRRRRAGHGAGKRPGAVVSAGDPRWP